MATTVTVNPISLSADPGAWAASTGSDKVTLVNDASDGTYITDTPNVGSTYIGYNFADAALPVGSAIQSIIPTVRASQAAGSEGMSVSTQAWPVGGAILSASSATFVPTPSIVNYVLGGLGSYHSLVVGNTAKDAATKLRLVLLGGTSQDHRAYKISLAVTYILPPTSSGLAIAAGELVNSTKPLMTFVYNQPDGVAQYQIQAATWLVSDLASYAGGQAAFEADPNAAFTDAAGVGAPSFGAKAAKAWTVDDSTGLPGWQNITVPEWRPTQSLPNTGAMKTYLRVSGLYSGSRLSDPATAGISSLAFTMASVPPPAPTAVVALFQSPAAPLVGDRNKLYRTKITVSLPTHTGSRRTLMERKVEASGVWQVLPIGLKTVNGTAQDLVFYDTATVPGIEVRYRATARDALFDLSGTAVNGNTVTPTFDAFVLRDPLDEASASVVSIQGDLTTKHTRYGGSARGLSSVLPTVTFDAAGGRGWSLEAIVSSEAEYLALAAMIDSGKTLVLQSDMAGWWRWVTPLGDWTETLIRQTGRRTAGTRSRRINVDFVETWPIAGQATGWGQ